MTVLDFTVPTPDGDCPASLHLPEGDGPWPAVIMYPDAVGARPTFRAMADRMAGLGYATLVPDVYYRAGDWAPFDVATVFADPDERTRMMGLARGLTTERIVADAGAFLAFLAGRPEVAGDRVGTTGYCMGGRISLLVASHHPRTGRRGGVVPRRAAGRRGRPGQPRAGRRPGSGDGVRRRGRERPDLPAGAARPAGEGLHGGGGGAHDRDLPRRPRLRGAGQRALRRGGRRAALGGVGVAVRVRALV